MVDQAFSSSDADGVAQLYSAFASDYDSSFDAPSLRNVYDEVAWQLLAPLLPPNSSTILDIGCGTGRWVARCLALEHRVIGIEPAPGMQRVIRDKVYGPNFTLIPTRVEEANIPNESVDVVLAMGSLQYVIDPLATIERVVGWLRPGGLLALHVDGLVALTLELLRLGRTDEALERLNAGWGVFSFGEERARLHLFDARRLVSLLMMSGLTCVEARGLLVTPTGMGRGWCEAEVARDIVEFTALEARFSSFATMADAGKHIMAWGRRPT